MYIDGSFVTVKQDPADFDGCWEATGVNADLLDPVLLDLRNRRAAQKTRFGGELFLAHMPADLMGTSFLDFFRGTGTPVSRKGSSS